MHNTLVFWILLLPSLLVKGGRFCTGDTSIAEVDHTFEEYNVSLVFFS